jgi:putative transposase
MSLEERRKLVDVELAKSEAKKDRLSIVKQCEVLDIRRSWFYCTATLPEEEDLRVMCVMDDLHMEDPCMGTRVLSKELRARGIMVGRARVRRLMHLMRIKALSCVQHTSVIDRIKYKHPSLLRGLEIDRRDQVWSVDMTYLPLRGGFMYMVAVIDVHTRYLLNWSISNSI